MTQTQTMTQTGTPLGGARTQADWAAVPRVNLLPPEIIQARRFARMQRKLAGVALLAVTVCAGATWWAQTTVTSAQAEVDAALGQSQTLTVEKATYAEVPKISAQIDAALATRERAMATDVLWYRYLNDIALAASNNIWLTTMTASVSGSLGTATGTGTGGPLAPAGIGSLTITGQTSTYPEVAGWLEALDSISGVKGSALSDSSRDTGTGANTSITFGSSSVITSDALSHRYDRKAS